ncbi:MAG: hypothetical protein M1118_08280 [Chloroflexi bacterium]|nr:hypothetical protein [Chloroflexota bacterium]
MKICLLREIFQDYRCRVVAIVDEQEFVVAIWQSAPYCGSQEANALLLVSARRDYCQRYGCPGAGQVCGMWQLIVSRQWWVIARGADRRCLFSFVPVAAQALSSTSVTRRGRRADPQEPYVSSGRVQSR